MSSVDDRAILLGLEIGRTLGRPIGEAFAQHYRQKHEDDMLSQQLKNRVGIASAEHPEYGMMLDAQGNVTGWLHRFALPSIMSTFMPGVDYAQDWEIASASDVPLDIKNFKVEVGQAPAHVRIGWMRSVINIPHGFSVNVGCTIIVQVFYSPRSFVFSTLR